MQLDEVTHDPDGAAARGAALMRRQLAGALERRGTAFVAFSGGRTPWKMLRRLAQAPVDWTRVHVFQVDERWAPDGDDARNLTHLRKCLPESALLHPVPVAEAGSPEEAAELYAEVLAREIGRGGQLDAVHLGLGEDGHTASLVPGDPVLEVTDRDVAATGEYRGHRRVTFTYPLINRARTLVWLVCGGDKRHALRSLLVGDPAIPAGRVRGERQIVVADSAAAGPQRDERPLHK
ncbi:MAG TPA: 6-phosphogluconolactonase [Gammaproteobacteria bacterium]|nr:6-phosphogluconolactonase [Gammaproteobacteria bacterium]